LTADGACRTVPREEELLSVDELRVGNVEILALTDATASVAPSVIFTRLSDADWQPFRHWLDQRGDIPLRIPSFVVRSQGKTILIDSGIGAKNRQYFPNGRLPDVLAEQSIRPDDIDVVMATHIHVDHVGWHTTTRGDEFIPTFPNATYVFHEDEFRFFTSPEQVGLPQHDYVRDCVVPLTDHPRLSLVDGEHKLTDELVLMPTPGHTPAHVSIAIMSAGEAAVLIGDICHHPAQLIETSWSPVFDMNPVLAAETREKLVRRIEDERLTVIAGHFPSPGFGRVVKVNGRRTWQSL
jgi:glyoxylase-like metal-dependent hydrolase (beta-lactamase superfamily II)